MSECRICLESNNSHDFITPCRCSGTAGVVHEQCLQKWRTQCYNNPDKYNKCACLWCTHGLIGRLHAPPNS